MLLTTVLAALVGSAAAAQDRRTFAVLRHYGDGPLMDCRIDPIVQPGGPSAHVHTFMGANNIGFNTTGEDLRKSTCTTAMPKADLSAYWFPKLYFKDPVDGKLEPVRFFYNVVYYFFDATNDDTKAFPLGMQMVSGNAMARAAPVRAGGQNLDPSRGTVNSAQITCPRTNFDPPSWPAGSDGSTAGIGDPNNRGSGMGFPLQDCDGFASPMRIDVHFPSCYNPAAGLTNFRANTAFPTDAGNGKLDCPKGWIHVPHLFFETYWDTHALLPRYQHLIGQESPFVFANGDATGFSAHGDFLSGWDETALQQVIDNCDAGHAGIHQCPGLIGGVNNESDRCKATCPVDEVVTGKLDRLPGNNPLAGWKYGAGAPAPNPPAPAPNPPAPSAPAPSAPAPSAPAPSAPAPSAPAPSAPAPSAPAPSAPAPSQPAPEPETTSEPAPLPSPTSSQVPTTLVPVPVPTLKDESGSSDATSTTEAPSSSTGGSRQTVWDTVTVWQTTTVYADGSAPAAPTSSPGSPTTGAKDIGSFKYAGCFRDASDRVLDGKIRPNLGKVSNSNCVAYCAEKGWSIAGTEYGGQCYCGNTLSTVEKLDESACSVPCEGAADETCGGSWALSLYTKDGASPAKASKRHVHKHLAMHHRRGYSHGHS